MRSRADYYEFHESKESLMDGSHDNDSDETLTDEKSGYEIDVHPVFVTDNNYGADADGRRGVKMTFFDDVEVTEIRNEKGDVVKEKDVPKDIMERLDKLIGDMDF